MSSYTTEAKILQYLGLFVLPSPLTSLTDFINAVGKFIDNYCNRTFAQESSTTKLYDGDDTGELLIDDALTVSQIEILDEDGNTDYTLTYSGNDFYLYPANETPKKKIVINKNNAPIGIFPKGSQNIKLTGTFGNSVTASDDISLVATILVAGIIEENYIESTGDVKSESLGEYSVVFQDANIKKMADKMRIFDILDKYRILSV